MHTYIHPYTTCTCSDMWHVNILNIDMDTYSRWIFSLNIRSFLEGRKCIKMQSVFAECMQLLLRSQGTVRLALGLCSVNDFQLYDGGGGCGRKGRLSCDSNAVTSSMFTLVAHQSARMACVTGVTVQSQLCLSVLVKCEDCRIVN